MKKRSVLRMLLCLLLAAVLMTGAAATVYAVGETVYIGVDPHNGEGAGFFEGVVGQTVNQSLLPHYSNGDLVLEGYYTDSRYEHRFDLDNDLITGNLELHIKWVKSCTVTLSANREGFADQQLRIPQGGAITSDALEQALAGLKTSDGQYQAYHWYKDAACTALWNPNSDRVQDDLVLYADWGWTFESFLSLLNGRNFATKDGKYSITVSAWQGGKYSISNSSGGYSFFSGKLEKNGNVYTLRPAAAADCTTSFTMSGSMPVSASFTGNAFRNTTYYPCWLVYCDANGGFMSNAGQINVFDGGKASAPAKEDEPYREGYTFIGWYNEKEGGSKFDFGKAIHADTTIYAHWYREFTVTYDDNMEGGKTQQRKVEEGGSIPTDVRPTGAPAGRRFRDWYMDPAGKEKLRGPVTGDITVYAGWDRDNCTVSFDVQGFGTNPEPTEVLHGDLLNYCPNPSYGEYTFDGWYRNKECTWKWSFRNDYVTEDITLYAKWYEPCTVTFVTRGDGPTPESITVAYNSRISPPALGSVEGKSFDGWYYDENYNQKWQFEHHAVREDTTLYGYWKDDCMVSFFTDHGQAPQTQMIPYGETVSRPADPWEDGYVFYGWYRDSSFTTPWNFDKDRAPESYLTLYARWEKSVYIMVDPHNGGDALVLQGVTGEPLNLSALPPVSNGERQLEGWYTDAAYTVPFDPYSGRVVEGLTLHAKWSEEAPLPASTFANGGALTVSVLCLAAAAVGVGAAAVHKKRNKKQ